MAFPPYNTVVPPLGEWQMAFGDVPKIEYPAAVATAQPGAGTLAAGTYGYQIASIFGAGTSEASAEFTVATGSTGGVLITWFAQPLAQGYAIYGRTPAGEAFMTTVPASATSFLDDGSLPPSGTVPITNTTGGPLIFGGVDRADQSPNFPLLQVPSGLDLPPVRSGDASRPRDHGAFVGLDLYDKRTIVFDLGIKPDPASLALGESPSEAFTTARRELMTALASSTIKETPFFVAGADGILLACMARSRKVAFPVGIKEVAGAYSEGSCMVIASDPRLYETTQRTLIDIGDDTVVTNEGNVEMRPMLKFNGPVNAPSAANASLSGTPTLTFVNPLGAGTDVLAGDYLLVDLDLHDVLYWNHLTSSFVNVANWLFPGSTWWNVVPGDNDIVYNANSGTGDLAVFWASAWLSI